MDPAAPPAVGSTLTPTYLQMTDQNDDGDIDRFNNDSVNGSDVTASWPGDTVTINTPSGNITYVGTTFYTADGARYFTPTDGQVLQEGTFVSSSFVSGQGPLDVDDLGPSCFTPGTMIRLAEGEQIIETLRVGDLVETLDDGPQPVRLIMRGVFRAVDNFAPVRFEVGAIGNAKPLIVSPQHRMLISGWRAELLFGQSEVLAAAKHLINGTTITAQQGGTVEYIHLLFDKHQIVFAGGVPSESFYPQNAAQAHDRETMDEVMALFPELADHITNGCDTVRPVLRRREAVLLAA
jgi:hypothetical protein